MKTNCSTFLETCHEKVKADHQRGIAGLLVYGDPFLYDLLTIEMAAKFPLTHLKNLCFTTRSTQNPAVFHEKEHGKKSLSIFLSQYIFSVVPATLNALYHVAALAGNLFAMVLKPILLLFYYGLNKEGLREALRAFIEKGFNILTNTNQIIRSAISAIPFGGPFATYAYDLSEAVLLNLPLIHCIALKIDSYIHSEKLSDPPLPALVLDIPVKNLKTGEILDDSVRILSTAVLTPFTRRPMNDSPLETKSYKTLVDKGYPTIIASLFAPVIKSYALFRKQGHNRLFSILMTLFADNHRPCD